jgi:hypothetical protein
MKRSIRILSVLLLLIPSACIGQYRDDVNAGNALLSFERKIDEAVVVTNIPFLQTAYAEDFRFKHGTGFVDDKASWLKDVQKNKGLFVSRVIDSVEVEIHNNIGITNGRLTVTRKDKAYVLNYVRVYIRKDDQWQMIMHRTVNEID